MFTLWIFSIHTSYTYLIKCIECINSPLPEVTEKYKNTIQKLDEFIADYKSVFIIDELEKYSLNNIITSVFQKGIHQNLDDLQKDIDDGLSMIETICEKLNKYIDPKRSGCIKRDNNEKYGYYLYVTDNRAKIFQKSVKNLVNTTIQIGNINLDLKDVKFIKRGGNTHLEFKEYLDITNKYSSDKLKIQGVNKELFIQKCNEYYNIYKELFIKLVDAHWFY